MVSPTTSADDGHVLLRREAAVGRITLNRPDVMNALTPPFMREIRDAVAALEADEAIRAIIVDAAGRGFSAGGDVGFLDDMATMDPFEIKKTVYAAFGACVRTLKLCTKPTIAAVSGPAVGAGCEIALACDFRIAAPSAMFCESWINLGLISPLGGMLLLPRIVGLGKATEMLMLGTRVDAQEALRIGLVTEVVAGEALAGRVDAIAAQLAAGAPLGLQAMKEGLRRGMESTLAAEWEHNIYVQSMLIDSDDFAEGVAAMRDKRRPQFRGR